MPGQPKRYLSPPPLFPSAKQTNTVRPHRRPVAQPADSSGSSALAAAPAAAAAAAATPPPQEGPPDTASPEAVAAVSALLQGIEAEILPLVRLLLGIISLIFICRDSHSLCCT